MFGFIPFGFDSFGIALGKAKAAREIHALVYGESSMARTLTAQDTLTIRTISCSKCGVERGYSCLNQSTCRERRADAIMMLAGRDVVEVEHLPPHDAESTLP